MNTTLTPTTRHSHPPHEAGTGTRAAHPLGIIDRAALHLGMALIRWGRRPGRELARHERRANRLELALLYREGTHARAELERSKAWAAESALTRVR